MKLKRFDVVSAILEPKNIETLKPGMDKLIGKRFDFMASWIVENGTYKGQWAMTSVGADLRPYLWVPDEDLKDMVAK